MISAGAPTVHVGDLDLSSTVFGSLSPSSLLFSNATLASLHLTPPPGCSSCTYVYDVELAGKSLSSLSLPGLTLVDNATALQGTLLGDMNIDQVDWSSTQGGWNLALSAIQSDLPKILDCSSNAIDCNNPGSNTLADAGTIGKR